MPEPDEKKQSHRSPSDPWGVKPIIPPRDDESQPEPPADIPVVDPTVKPEVPTGSPLADLPEPMGQPIMRLPRIRITDTDDVPVAADDSPAQSPDAEPSDEVVEAEAVAILEDEDGPIDPAALAFESYLPVVAGSDNTTDIQEPATELLDTIQPVLYKEAEQPADEAAQKSDDNDEPQEVELVTGHFVETSAGPAVTDPDTKTSEPADRTSEYVISSDSYKPTGKHDAVPSDQEPTRQSGFRLTDYWLSLVLTAVILATGATILIIQSFADVLTGEPAAADITTGISQIDDTVPDAPVDVLPTIAIEEASPLEAYQRGRVVFASNRDGDFNLYLLDMATGAVEQIVGTEGSDERDPVWSPDGTQIMFISNQAGSNDLYITDQFGQNIIKLTDSAGSDQAPAWSPDGERIVFSRETIDGSLIYAADAACVDEGPGACEDAAAAIQQEGFNRFPDFTSDGRFMYTTAQFVGRPSRILIYNPLADSTTELAGTGVTDFDPNVSPDGSRIAFVSFAEGDQGDNDIWLMNEEGEGAVRLTSNPANDVEPVFSPDGRWVLFASDRGSDSNFELFALDLMCIEELGDDPDACEATVVSIVENLADDLAADWAE